MLPPINCAGRDRLVSPENWGPAWAAGVWISFHVSPPCLNTKTNWADYALKKLSSRTSGLSDHTQTAICHLAGHCTTFMCHLFLGHARPVIVVTDPHIPCGTASPRFTCSKPLFKTLSSLANLTSRSIKKSGVQVAVCVGRKNRRANKKKSTQANQKWSLKSRAVSKNRSVGNIEWHRQMP